MTKQDKGMDSPGCLRGILKNIQCTHLAMGKETPCWWWHSSISQGQNRWQSFVCPSLMPGSVANDVLWLRAHKNHSTSRQFCSKKTEDRALNFMLSLGEGGNAGGKIGPQTCPLSHKHSESYLLSYNVSMGGRRQIRVPQTCLPFQGINRPWTPTWCHARQYGWRISPRSLPVMWPAYSGNHHHAHVCGG